MAQHIAIREWEKESWYEEIMELIRSWVDKLKDVEGTLVGRMIYNGYSSDTSLSDEENRKNNPLVEDQTRILNHFIEQMSEDYKWDRDDKIDDRVLNMRIYKDVELKQKYWNQKLDTVDEYTSSLNDIKLYTCHFEIHLDKDNKINEVYIPL